MFLRRSRSGRVLSSGNKDKIGGSDGEGSSSFMRRRRNTSKKETRQQKQKHEEEEGRPEEGMQGSRGGSSKWERGSRKGKEKEDGCEESPTNEGSSGNGKKNNKGGGEGGGDENGHGGEAMPSGGRRVQYIEGKKRPEELFTDLDVRLNHEGEKRNEERLHELGVEQVNLKQFNSLRESVSLRLSRLGANPRNRLNDNSIRRVGQGNTDPELVKKTPDMISPDEVRDRSFSSADCLPSDEMGIIEIERGSFGAALSIPRIATFAGVSRVGSKTPRTARPSTPPLGGSPVAGENKNETRLSVGTVNSSEVEPSPPAARKKSGKRDRQQESGPFDSTGDDLVVGGGGASPNPGDEQQRELEVLRFMVKAWESKMIGLVIKNKEKALDLASMCLDAIPPSLFAGPNKHLRLLNFSNNRLSEVPRAISQLQSLRELNLSGNLLTTLPEELFQLTQLSVLDLSINRLLCIPSYISQLTCLEDLLLSYNELSELPPEICSLPSLMGLSLHHNALDHRAFPSDLTNLTNLLALDLSFNQFGEIPPQICFLSSLQELVFSHNKLTYMREEKLPLSKLSSLLLLDLSHNQLTKFGPVASLNICSLRELVVLSLNNNKLTSLPPGLWRLKNLRSLNIAGNPELLARIPEEHVKAGTKEILKFLCQKEDEKKAKAQAEADAGAKKRHSGHHHHHRHHHTQFLVSRDIGQFLALPSSNNSMSTYVITDEKRSAGTKWRERVMQLRKSEGKVDKAKLRVGSLPNIAGNKEEQISLRNSQKHPSSSEGASVFKSSGLYSNISLSSSSGTTVTSAELVDLLESSNTFDTMILPCADWHIETDELSEGRDVSDDFCVDLNEVPGTPIGTSRLSLIKRRTPRNHTPSVSDVELTEEENEPGYPLERESNYTPLYQKFFYKKAHVNLVGVDPTLGPLFVSITKERDSVSHAHWFLIRSQYGSLLGAVGDPSGRVSRIAHFPTTSGLLQGVKKTTYPYLQQAELHHLKITKGPKLLKKLERELMVSAHKFGVIYCKDGQISEDEMLNNVEGSPAFEEFLDSLGDKIRLKGWNGYCGGLDTENDRMGKHSIYRRWRGLEFMFHVSTLLPFRSKDRQQVQRKQHIGNDVVVIIFVDGRTPFSPISFTSQFNKVFVVVQKDESSKGDITRYRVAVTASKPVPLFGPPLSGMTLFAKGHEFREFLFTKLVNAERAAYQTYPLSERIIRTRCSLLTELIEQSLPPVKWRSVAQLARQQRERSNNPSYRSSSNDGALPTSRERSWSISPLSDRERSGSGEGFIDSGGSSSLAANSSTSSSSSAATHFHERPPITSMLPSTPRFVRKRSSSADGTTGKQVTTGKERSPSVDVVGRVPRNLSGKEISSVSSSLSGLSDDADVSAADSPRAGGGGGCSGDDSGTSCAAKKKNKKEEKRERKERKEREKEEKKEKKREKRQARLSLSIERDIIMLTRHSPSETHYLK